MDARELKNQKLYEWRKKNPEKVRLINARAYHNNREERLRQSKEYYQEHGAEKRAYQSQIIVCPCGASITRAHKSRHLRTRTHANRLALKQEE